MSAAVAMMADEAAAPPVIQMIDVDRFYEGQRNEFLCILGPSGCGKSTLLKIVAGLMRQSSGDVLLNGKPIKGPGLDRGIVFQDPALFAWLTALRMSSSAC
jgi:NitT/TauT family transport system ATP-binding protein